MRYLFTILILVLTTMFASLSYAESYVCSADLTRFGQPGEVETTIHKRSGNSFITDENDRSIILEENSNFLTLYDGGPSWGFILHIDKNTKEFGELYFDMQHFRKHPPHPQTFGKCVVVN